MWVTYKHMKKNLARKPRIRRADGRWLITMPPRDYHSDFGGDRFFDGSIRTPPLRHADSFGAACELAEEMYIACPGCNGRREVYVHTLRASGPGGPSRGQWAWVPCLCTKRLDPGTRAAYKRALRHHLKHVYSAYP